MLSSEAFISLDEASEEVRGIGDDVGLADRLIIGGSEEMEAILDRQIVTRGTITEYHSFRRASSDLYVRHFPIISVTSIHEDETRAYTNTALVLGTDYVIDYDTGKITRISGNAESSWLCGFEAVRIVWTGGYANQAAVPGDLKRIARELFAMQYREIAGKRQGMSSASDDLGTRGFFGPVELTSHMVSRLERHRNYDVGRHTRSRWSTA